MKLGRWLFALSALFLLVSGSAAFAATPDECHRLMTEKECVTFKSTLAGLPPGPSREQFLVEHAALIQYRSLRCSSEQYARGKPAFYPQIQQVAQRF